MLQRDTDNEVLGGVCSGLGEYWDIDPTIVRILFILAFSQGFGFLLYVILWAIIPAKQKEL